MKPGKRAFTPAEVGLIRQQWDAGTCDVRGWAQAKGCVPETIRKIGRRETYLEIETAIEEPVEADLQASLDKLRAGIAETPAMQATGLLNEIKKEQS